MEFQELVANFAERHGVANLVAEDNSVALDIDGIALTLVAAGDTLSLSAEIGELRHLADDPAARLEKTPGQYERDFATQLGNLRQRTLERIQSNLFLVGDFRDSLRRIESRCNAATAGGQELRLWRWPYRKHIGCSIADE
ncbi:MAG: hypothetical protein IKP97_04450 [Kiritimatiellae bacterium]|nr:hypothetical protein [Kiritimatiellia bacterium]